MTTFAVDIKSKEDLAFFSALAKRLKLKSRVLTMEEKEDIALAYAIDEGRQSGYVEEAAIVQLLSKKKK